jgi:hypothetical protein
MELGIKNVYVRMLLVIKSRLHQNFQHHYSNLIILILKFGISYDRLCRSILELIISSN